MFSSLFFVLAATATAPAPATETVPAPASRTEAVVAEDDQVVCKRQGTVGTRLGAKKVCMTKAQWRLQQADSRREVRNMQRAKHGPSGS